MDRVSTTVSTERTVLFQTFVKLVLIPSTSKGVVSALNALSTAVTTRKKNAKSSGNHPTCATDAKT